jgi:hypothetical protein
METEDYRLDNATFASFDSRRLCLLSSLNRSSIVSVTMPESRSQYIHLSPTVHARTPYLPWSDESTFNIPTQGPPSQILLNIVYCATKTAKEWFYLFKMESKAQTYLTLWRPYSVQ